MFLTIWRVARYSWSMSSFAVPGSGSWRAVFTALTLCGALAACGGDDQPAVPDADPAVPDAMPREVITGTRTLAVGMLIEGVMTGGPSDHAVIHLEAPVSELDWNIHGHDGDSVQTVYEELNRMIVDYVFVPSAQTDWWLLLRNSGAAPMDVEVRVELYGDLVWAWE